LWNCIMIIFVIIISIIVVEDIAEKANMLSSRVKR
jgi:hypothetical protein